MVNRSADRAGHSLPELIVATTFLAATLVAVGGSALLGARWTDRAATRQRALWLAEQVLDSLATLPGAGPGHADVEGLRLTWTDTGDGHRVEVRTTGDGPLLVILEAARVPEVPVLPDVGTDPSDGFTP